jgi:bacteriocin-like protein
MTLRPEMEQIMSNTSNLDHRELTETELDAVSGGLVVTAGSEYSTVTLAMHKAGAGSSANGPGYNA